jgi:DNA mismatch endonuclease, patch repair protein
VPRPVPSSPAASTKGRANKRRDTKPELELRSLLHRAGLRFRVDLRIRAGERFIRPDVVFTKRKVAVFVDGCFWHACPEHGTNPKANRDYWEPKLSRNVQRDRESSEALETEGWHVIRIWEHECMGDRLGDIRGALGWP